LTLKVADLDISYDFYTSLGMRAFGKYETAGIIEFRGGTHLLLCSVGTTDSVPESRTGQLAAPFRERLDFRIAGKRVNAKISWRIES